MYIGKCDIRDYGLIYFIDVGLKNDNIDFELLKELWYHNWGYTHWKSGKIITPYVMWFENSIKTNKKNIILKIKYNYVKKKIL